MKPILIIDPGHGGKDPGGGTCALFREKDLVLQISLYQAERFRQLGVAVELTRTTDEYLDSGPRTERVKRSGARYCISNHINAAANPAARGAETIHSIHNGGKLAKALLEAICSEGMPNRRFFAKASQSNPARDYYFMHRDTGAATTIIVEYGFASNDEDAALLSTRWKDYAEAVVRAFCVFIDHPYQPPVAVPVSQKSRELPTIDKRIGIVHNGKEIDTAAYLIEGTSYVPFRILAEMFGAEVGWDGKNAIIKLQE